MQLCNSIGKAIFRAFLIVAMLSVCHGCAGQKMREKQHRIRQMSDRELTDRYHEISERLDELDREAEREKTREKEMQSPDGLGRRDYPEDMFYHLHIGDKWQEFRQEKKLLLKELGKRGIDPDV